MNKIFSKTKEIIFREQSGIFSSTLLIAGMMIVSRFAGFIRYRILSGYFTKEELDIYFAAFRIPDLVFEILINGALSTTFIPFFVEYQRRSKYKNTIISSVINAFILLLAFIITLLIVFLPALMPLIAPGFDAETNNQIVFLSRILLIGQLPFLVIGNFLTGMSQAKKSFLIPAFAPVLYNIVIIICIYYFAPTLHILAPIIGVVLGAVAFLLIQLPVFYIAKFKYKLVISHLNESYRFFKNALPRILTIIVGQIDATIDLSIATLLGPGSYTVFYLAQRLQLLPVSIIGMAVGQASLPYITEIYQDGNMKKFKEIVIRSILHIFFFTIPAAAFLIITRTATVRLFFGGEKFDWDATVATALTLSAFSLSLPLHSVYYFIVRCFYATFDTKTPFYVGTVSIVFGALLSLFFTLVLGLPIWALALSFSIVMSARTIFLIYLMIKKIKGMNLSLLFSDTVKMLVATINTSVITYFLIRLLDGLILDTSRTINVFILVMIGFIFFSSMYIFLCWLFGIHELYFIGKMIIKMKIYKKRVLEVYQGVD